MKKIISISFHFCIKYIVLLSIITSLLLYTSSMILTKFDPNFTYRWISFWLHNASIFIILLAFFISCIKKCHCIDINFNEVLTFGIILGLAEAVNLLFLQEYPFVSLGDEVRDGGLDAMKIAQGTIKNIFAYGRYEAHGLIIPTITSIFYHIFQSSVLTYRLPSALLACIDVFLLYILLRLVINRTAAFWGACALIILPLHIFFGRTEVVVMFSSFWTSVILLALYALIKQRKVINYALLGTALGFASTFHASARTFAVLTLFVIVAIDIITIMKEFINYENLKGKIGKLLILFLFCIIGFGPQLLFTTPQIFFHVSEFTFKDDLTNNLDYSSLFTMDNVKKIKQNYLKSVVVWFYEPVTSRYPHPIPILPPLLTIFFLLGAGYSFFILKNKFLYIVIFLGLAIPLTNSAITSWINAAHRLLPLLPIGAFFIGIGIWFIFHSVRNKYIKGLIFLFIASYMIFQIYTIFINLPFNDDKKLDSYLSMHIINFLQSNPTFSITRNDQSTSNTRICVAVSPAMYQTLITDQMYQEQWQYFLPLFSIDKLASPQISDNEAYIFKSVCPFNVIPQTSKVDETSCHASEKSFYCPPGYSGKIAIHY